LFERDWAFAVGGPMSVPISEPAGVDLLLRADARVPRGRGFAARIFLRSWSVL